MALPYFKYNGAVNAPIEPTVATQHVDAQWMLRILMFIHLNITVLVEVCQLRCTFKSINYSLKKSKISLFQHCRVAEQQPAAEMDNLEFKLSRYKNFKHMIIM